MSYAVTANSNTTLVTTSVVGDTLTLDFQAQQYGTAEILPLQRQLRRSDIVSDTFIVTITNVNDLPVVASALPDITPIEDDPNLAVSAWALSFMTTIPVDDAAYELMR